MSIRAVWEMCIFNNVYVYWEQGTNNQIYCTWTVLSLNKCIKSMRNGLSCFFAIQRDNGNSTITVIGLCTVLSLHNWHSRTATWYWFTSLGDSLMSYDMLCFRWALEWNSYTIAKGFWYICAWKNEMHKTVTVVFIWCHLLSYWNEKTSTIAAF